LAGFDLEFYIHLLILQFRVSYSVGFFSFCVYGLEENKVVVKVKLLLLV